MSLHPRLLAGWRQLRWREVAARPGRCPFCGPTVLLRLQREETGVRCARCSASAVHLSIGWAVRAQVADLGARDVYELSSRGPLVAHLSQHARSLVLSEYFDGVAAGSRHRGVRCEDVQALSFADASFDLITHTEVLEHVPDDARAFAELYRVLRPGGLMLFTVPYAPARPQTLERARIAADGGIEHLQSPAYHGDHLRGHGQVLVWRDYGADLPDRLAAAGFVACVLPPSLRIPWQLGRCVLLAQRPKASR
jgi:SAM-dependent methyltransferase